MLEINNLHLTRGKDKILNGVTFEIRINQIVGIYGSISSGKTSMVEALFNFIPFDNGTVIFENKKIAYNQPKHISKIRNKIGYVPQKDYFLQAGNILENIQWIGRVSKDKAIELATYTEISDILYSNIDNLSGSEKFRFKLTLALLKEPQLLFIDEPLTHIFPKYINDFTNLIDKISKHRKIGVLILSQYQPLFENKIFTHLFKLEQGRLNGA
ncbi:MAG TPA: ATP-binding cassette domain-containing protein [Campylobacterales bacterium]|nr:ATP-binding cassette domain-containing protein [Campylobacterales bacterium]